MNKINIETGLIMNPHQIVIVRYLQVKIRFRFSDIRRFANFAMRGAQYMEALHPARAMFEAQRLQVNHFEIIAGMHWWLRQLELHAGFYRFWTKRVRETAGNFRQEHALAQAVGAGTQTPATHQGQGLKGTDRLKFALLSCPQFTNRSAHSTTQMRVWMQGRFKREFSDLAGTMKEALRELTDCGLLTEDEDQPKTKGRKVEWYRKPTYAAVLANPNAKLEVTRLELYRDNFES